MMWCRCVQTYSDAELSRRVIKHVQFKDVGAVSKNARIALLLRGMEAFVLEPRTRSTRTCPHRSLPR